MDASQGPQLFGEIPAGGTVVQGQQGPVFRRRHGPGEKTAPLGARVWYNTPAAAKTVTAGRRTFFHFTGGPSFYRIFIYYNVRKRFCVCES